MYYRMASQWERIPVYLELLQRKIILIIVLQAEKHLLRQVMNGEGNWYNISRRKQLQDEGTLKEKGCVRDAYCRKLPKHRFCTE